MDGRPRLYDDRNMNKRGHEQNRIVQGPNSEQYQPQMNPFGPNGVSYATSHRTHSTRIMPERIQDAGVPYPRTEYEPRSPSSLLAASHLSTFPVSQQHPSPRTNFAASVSNHAGPFGSHSSVSHHNGLENLIYHAPSTMRAYLDDAPGFEGQDLSPSPNFLDSAVADPPHMDWSPLPEASELFNQAQSCTTNRDVLQQTFCSVSPGPQPETATLATTYSELSTDLLPYFELQYQIASPLTQDDGNRPELRAPTGAVVGTQLSFNRFMEEHYEVSKRRKATEQEKEDAKTIKSVGGSCSSCRAKKKKCDPAHPRDKLSLKVPEDSTRKRKRSSSHADLLQPVSSSARAKSGFSTHLDVPVDKIRRSASLSDLDVPATTKPVVKGCNTNVDSSQDLGSTTVPNPDIGDPEPAVYQEDIDGDFTSYVSDEYALDNDPNLIVSRSAASRKHQNDANSHLPERLFDPTQSQSTSHLSQQSNTSQPSPEPFKDSARGVGQQFENHRSG